MPRNNNLQPITLPMEISFGQDPETEYKNNLDAIKVSLIQYPTIQDLRAYLPQFIEATWSKDPWLPTTLTIAEKDQLIIDAIEGRALPTALETIRMTFLLEGICLQEVTHILRHRLASFSADCSGDKWWHKKASLVPESVQNSPAFYARWKEIVDATKQLYVDMIDSRDVSIMDARTILPRNLETFYYMSFSLKDAIAFIRQRQDEQIQPATDNVIAMQMALEILRHIPHTYNMFDFNYPSWFYAKMARSGKGTNLYFPDEQNDTFDWHPDDFIYQGRRRDLRGTNPPDGDGSDHYDRVKERYCQTLAELKRHAKEILNVS